MERSWDRVHAFKRLDPACVAAGGLLPAEWRRLTLLVDLLSLQQMAGRSAGRATDDLRRLIETTVASVG
jgi:hypothetical protein